MVFESKNRSKIFKIENIEAGPHVFFSDILGSKEKSVPNPIVGSWFRIEKGHEAVPLKYEHDETGVVLEGDITLRDEAGHTVTLLPGDTFIIHRGSTVAFSSSKYGLAYKCGTRLMAQL